MPTDDGDQPPTYRILDAQGRPIGRVRPAAGGLPLGRGAGTVLLIRDCGAALRWTACRARPSAAAADSPPRLQLYNT
jgi:hypothetical protein